MTADGLPGSVTIHGTGLIGTSLGLALKARVAGIRVYGIDSPEILARAERCGAIDGPGGPASDLVILAAPVGTIMDILDGLSPGSSLILDVGSTKAAICRKAQARGLPFVGGHPMTGSEKSGPEAASADLFLSQPFFLCPISSTPGNALSTMTRLVEAIGGNSVVMSAEEHDRVVAQLSHLPQILSTLLADQTSEHRNLAGPGWRSFTRLAASPFSVWRDILLTSGPLPQELRFFCDRMHSVLDALNRGNMEEIEAIFDRANHAVLEEGRE